MSDAARRREARERYQKMLSTIAHNTTERQPPGIRPATVRLHMCSHANCDIEGVNSAMRAAIENDDLIKWCDAEGNVRLTRYAEPDLKRLAKHIGETVKNPQTLARVNQALANERHQKSKSKNI